jgi:hypothetical protein
VEYRNGCQINWLACGQPGGLILCRVFYIICVINPLNAESNSTCHLLPLLVHHILHVSRVRVKECVLED